ncbi:MAG: hypothetical protein PVSMB2_38030 [Ktedonobacteraceae bacterium]
MLLNFLLNRKLWLKVSGMIGASPLTSNELAKRRGSGMTGASPVMPHAL